MAACYGLTHCDDDDSFALVPCLMNKELAVVIAATCTEDGRTQVMPLFLACPPRMDLTARTGHEREPDGAGCF